MKPKIQILGIVNLTDDSYYAPSRARSCEAFMGRVRQLVSEGADIIDIGACSTRPGSQPVGAEEEWRRIEPALRALRSEFPELPVSIDTYWASVVEHVYDAVGSFMVNDISAGAYDEAMLPNSPLRKRPMRSPYTGASYRGKWMYSRSPQRSVRYSFSLLTWVDFPAPSRPSSTMSILMTFNFTNIVNFAL